MKPIEILTRLNSIQKYALLMLEANQKAPIRGKLWFQKEMFLLSHLVPSLAEELGYEPALMGPISDSLDWNLDQLQAIGLLKKGHSGLVLTDSGRDCARLVSDQMDPSQKEQAEELKELLNDLSKDELLAFVYSLHPKMTVESDELESLQPKRKSIAVGLFAKRKVGLERGASIAGLPVQAFSSLLRRKGIARYAE